MTRFTPELIVWPEAVAAAIDPVIAERVAAVEDNEALMAACARNGWTPRAIILGATLAEAVALDPLPAPKGEGE